MPIKPLILLLFLLLLLYTYPTFDHLSVNDTQIENVTNFKLLGVIISSNLTWNLHIDYICTNASKRLFSAFTQTLWSTNKKTGHYYSSFVRPILEYACQVWHFSLTQKLIEQVEQIQRRALRIIIPTLSYNECLDSLNMDTLYERRRRLCYQMYKSALDPGNKLNGLLPKPKVNNYSLRNNRTFPLLKCRTERFSKSFIPKSISTWDNCASY